jgi:hypothetical protein
MLLIPVLATSISPPPEITITGDQTFTISIFGAPEGSRLVPSWDNEKLDVFPGYATIDQPNSVQTIYIIPQLGLCGKTNLTFSIASTSAVSELDLGSCFMLPGEANPDTSYLGLKMWELKDEIDNLNYYLQMSPEIQDYINTLYAKIEEANSIDITVSQAEYTRKDLLVHGIEADINDLDLAFRGINQDIKAPAIIQLSSELADYGDKYIMGDIEEKLDAVESFDKVPFYKRKIRTDITEAGEQKKYTMFKVNFYNPTNIQQKFFFAEDIEVDVTDKDPYVKEGITIWHVTIDPKDIQTIKYGVYQDVDRAITSFAFVQKEPEPTCSDGIRNQDEVDVDCGGPCPPCPEPEAVATCFDGLWNQGEGGVDCGGPCAKACEEEPDIEPEHDAEKNSDFFSNILQSDFFKNYISMIKMFLGSNSQ